MPDAERENPHDAAALFLSKTIVDLENTSYSRASVKAHNFESFGHEFKSGGKWSFFVVEDRTDEYNVTSIWLKQVETEGNNTNVMFERILFRDASRAKLYIPDDQLTGSIVMVF